jgi:hypothetical protein
MKGGVVNRRARRIAIPRKHIKKVRELLDAYLEAFNQQAGKEFWGFIEEIIPETREGQWRLDNKKHRMVEMNNKIEEGRSGKSS